MSNDPVGMALLFIGLGLVGLAYLLNTYWRGDKK